MVSAGLDHGPRFVVVVGAGMAGALGPIKPRVAATKRTSPE
ncbi:MAG TPA: hypothetical protein VFJ21_01650 [Mycobacteriales bacterium]|jgi:hypothetical protein|nr:hypothetical protein [Mycobacteriales bacterium]